MECHFCTRIFRSAQAVTQHENAMHPWRCDLCYFASDSEESLDEHMDDEHTIWHRCEICLSHNRTVQFRMAHELEQHLQITHGRRFYCDDCQRPFMNQNNLDHHLRSSVHVGKSVRCPWCTRQFVNLTGVTLHLESGRCSSGVSRKAIDSYIRERDHNHVITKKLLTYDDQYTTRTTATSASWNGSCYECYFCHRGYGSLHALNQHLNSPAHEQKRYHCPRCRVEFVVLSGLVNHLESERCGQFRFNLNAGSLAGMVQKMIRY